MIFFFKMNRFCAQVMFYSFLLLGQAARAEFTGYVGLSEVKLVYDQDLIPSLNQWNHTLKGGLEYHVPGGLWGIGLTGSATLADSFGAGDASLRFYSFNARAHYRVFESYRFRFLLALGFYYTTTSWINYGGGYTDIMGPQIFPSGWYAFPDGIDLGAYFKYSPISSEFTLLPIKGSHEFSTGLIFLFPQGWLIHWGRIGLNLDYTELGYFQGDAMRAQLSSLGFLIQY